MVGQDWRAEAQASPTQEGTRMRVGYNHFVGVFFYTGMPPAEAERNMSVSAKEVMPPLQRLEGEPFR